VRISLTIRIFLGFIAILLVFSATTAYGVLRLDAIRKDLLLTSQGYMQLTRALTQVKTIAESKDAYVERAVAEEDPRVRQYLIRYARDFYPRVLRERLDELSASARRLASARDLPPPDERFAGEIADRLERAVELNRAADAAGARFFEAVDDPESSVTAEQASEQKEASQALAREIRLIALNLDNKIAQGVLRAETQERKAVWALIGLSVTGLVVGLLITLLMTRALRPLTTLTDGARAISRGGFDVHIAVERGDEIGTLARAFNDMAEALKDREAVLARRSIEVESLNAFLENVLDSVTTGVVVCNRDLEVTVINRAAKRLLGLTLQDPIGRPLSALPLEGAVATHQEELRAILDDGPPLHLEAQALKPAGGPAGLVDLRVLQFTRPGEPKNIGGLVFLLDDVTEREQTRERLLQNERLAAMGRLAAQVAHEIRNPLSSIGLNCELLSDELRDADSFDAEIKRLLAAVSREIDRLTELTEGYLRYARLPEASKRPSDVAALVTDVADFVRADFERSGLRLEVSGVPELPTISIDPSRVRLALVNLLRNAADVTPEGGTVSLTIEEVDGAVQISVDDEGPGVPDDDEERLFEPFFSTKDDGTGLGLSVTREVALEHGGSAGYEPRADRGSRFFIRLARTPDPSSA